MDAMRKGATNLGAKKTPQVPAPMTTKVVRPGDRDYRFWHDQVTAARRLIVGLPDDSIHAVFLRGRIRFYSELIMAAEKEGDAR